MPPGNAGKGKEVRPACGGPRDSGSYGPAGVGAGSAGQLALTRPG